MIISRISTRLAYDTKKLRVNYSATSSAAAIKEKSDQQPKLTELFPATDFDNEGNNQSKSLAIYENIKDLSKMKTWHRCLLHNEITPQSEFTWQKEKWALKERYAQYGSESGVNPGVMWMTPQELKERQMEEDEWNPNLANTIRLYKEKNEAEQKAKIERIKFVEQNLKKYPAIMKEYLDKKLSKKEEIFNAEQQRLKKLKEVRNSFGYDIEEDDPRFKVKMLLKEDEEKTLSRVAKKKEKQAKMLEKLQAMTASLSAQMPDEMKTEVEEKLPDDPDTVAQKQ